MKAIIFSLIFLPLFSVSQKLTENKVDEFTKNTVKRTSWNVLTPANKFRSMVRVSAINGLSTLNLKVICGGDVFSVEEGAKLMLMTETDSVVTLSNDEYAISRIGEGSDGMAFSALRGVNLTFIVPESSRGVLRENKIKKIRLYTTDGYVESEVKSGNADLIMKQFDLVYK